MTCLVFKTSCVDREILLRECAFSFTRRTLFPSQNKRNMRDKAKGLCITSERCVGELGVQCLSTLNVGPDSMQQSYIGSPANLYRFVFPPPPSYSPHSISVGQMMLHPSHRLTSSRSFARVHYLYSGRAIEWGSLMGCENR